MEPELAVLGLWCVTPVSRPRSSVTFFNYLWACRLQVPGHFAGIDEQGQLVEVGSLATARVKGIDAVACCLLTCIRGLELTCALTCTPAAQNSGHPVIVPPAV